MKRQPLFKLLILLVAIILPLSAFADGDKFSYSDVRAGTLAPTSTRAQATEAFGQPLSVEMIVEGETSDIIDVYIYDGLKLWFRQDSLYKAEWTGEGMETVRGITVGAPLERVTGMFFRDYTQKESYVLYESGVLPSGHFLPPLGVIGHGDNRLTVCYQAPVEAYPAEVLGNPESYSSLPHATLVFELDPERECVTSVWWAIGELS